MPDQTTNPRVSTNITDPRTELAADAGTELASRRTGMSFQRTRMSADRTLMSVIRTALSLIAFGFTLYQFLQRLHEGNVIGNPKAGSNFGIALVVLGVAMVVVGIIYHVQFMYGLRREREVMTAERLIHGQSHFPISFTLVIAVLLLLLGVLAIASMIFHVGPFD